MSNHIGDMSARLRKLGSQIDSAETKLKLRRPLTLDHKVTNAELRARYSVLINAVDGNERDIEEHGRHVSDLEHSVGIWLANIDAGST